MADKKLNEVDKVTDMAYVPVILSDGSIGQIAKADLASVVAEQIKDGGIPVLPTSINPKDFNECVKTGVYGCGGITVSNGPTESPYGVLIVLNGSEGDSTYMCQIFAPFTSGKTFIRTRTGDWNELN